MRAVYHAYDGTEFNNAEECLAYEKCLVEKIHAFDDCNRPLNVKEIGLKEFIDEAVYVKFDTDEAAIGFDNLLYDYDCNEILSSSSYTYPKKGTFAIRMIIAANAAVNTICCVFV